MLKNYEKKENYVRRIPFQTMGIEELLSSLTPEDIELPEKITADELSFIKANPYVKDVVYAGTTVSGDSWLVETDARTVKVTVCEIHPN